MIIRMWPFKRYKRTAWLILAIAVSLLAGILPNQETTKKIYNVSVYYFLFTAFAIWLLLLANLYSKKLKSILREHYAGIILSVTLSILIFIISPPKFKILADETNLVGVSMMMYYDKTACLPIEGFYSDAGKPECSCIIDKRPLLFSFLTSLIHTVSGYRAGNGFVLNFILSVFILCVFYGFITRFFPKFYGFLSVIMLASCPIYMMCVTSSGFECLNLFFVIMTFLMIQQMMAHDNIRYADLFLLTIALLVQCRYESILFFLLFFMAAPALIKKQYFSKLTWVSYAIPLLFIPALWLRRIFIDVPDFNKVSQVAYEKPDVLFSLKYFFQNIHENIYVLLGVNPDFGFSPVISLLAIIGFYIIFKRKYVLKEDKESFDLLTNSGVFSFIILLCVISSYYWGKFTIAMDNRLALVFVPYLVFCAVYGLSICFKTHSGVKGLVIWSLMLCNLLLCWPYGIQQRIIENLALQYEYNSVLSYLKRYSGNKKDLLIIAEQPNLYIIQHYDAVRFGYANSHYEEMESYAKKKKILVIERYYRKLNKIFNRTSLSHFKTKEKITIPVTYEVDIKISEAIQNDGL